MPSRLPRVKYSRSESSSAGPAALKIGKVSGVPNMRITGTLLAEYSAVAT